MQDIESPFSYTPVFETRFRDILVHRRIPPADDDIIMVIDNEKFVGRPDLIAYHVYGTPELWWVFGVRNELEDPVHDLIPGLVIAIPHPDRIRDFL